MAIDTKGVALIELLVVLAVLSISLGVVSVSVAGSSQRALNAACTELQADLRYAQRQAVTENTKYEVLFSVTDNGYRLVRHSGGFGLEEIVKEKTFSDGISLISTTAAGSAVLYTTRGTTANPCTITLANNDYRVDLTVNLGSGRITQKNFIEL